MNGSCGARSMSGGNESCGGIVGAGAVEVGVRVVTVEERDLAVEV